MNNDKWFFDDIQLYSIDKCLGNDTASTKDDNSGLKSKKDLCNCSKLKKALAFISIVTIVFATISIVLCALVVNAKKNEANLKKLVEIKEEDIKSVNQQANLFESRYNELKNDYDNEKNRFNDLEDDYNDMKEKYDFYYNWAGCIDKKTKYYHHYDCEKFDSTYFWIFNEDYAKEEGYKPCPFCWEE